MCVFFSFKFSIHIRCLTLDRLYARRTIRRDFRLFVLSNVTIKKLIPRITQLLAHLLIWHIFSRWCQFDGFTLCTKHQVRSLRWEISQLSTLGSSSRYDRKIVHWLKQWSSSALPGVWGRRMQLGIFWRVCFWRCGKRSAQCSINGEKMSLWND